LSANDEALIKGLVQQAERAQAAGQREEAKRLLARAEAVAPQHPLVLNALAIDHLQAGNPARARELLGIAIRIDTQNPSLWLNLATALRALEESDAEDDALRRVLRLDPRNLFALLRQAERL